MVKIKELKLDMNIRITDKYWIAKVIGKIGKIEVIDKGDNTIKVSFPDLEDWWWFDLDELEYVTEKSEVEHLELELELAENAVNAVKDNLNSAKIALLKFEENNRVYSWKDLNNNAPTGVYKAQGVMSIDHAYRFYVNDKHEVLYVTCGHQGRDEIEKANAACWDSETFKKIDIELTVILS